MSYVTHQQNVNSVLRYVTLCNQCCRLRTCLRLFALPLAAACRDCLEKVELKTVVTASK